MHFIEPFQREYANRKSTEPCQHLIFANVRIVAHPAACQSIPAPTKSSSSKDNITGTLQIEDRGEAAKKTREELFGKYTKDWLKAGALANVVMFTGAAS